MNLILKTFTQFLDILFPEKCAVCQTLGAPLCGECLSKFPLASSTELPFAHAIFDYHHLPLKNALWRFKYKNARNFAKIFAENLYEKIVEELREDTDIGPDDKYMVIPIPLHKSRLRERGYNQSDLLAKELVRNDTNRIFEYAPDILIRTHKTKPQARAEKRHERLTNLRGAFVCVHDARVRERTIILIDDITTTGATLLAAKKALDRTHPHKILAFTIAH